MHYFQNPLIFVPANNRCPKVPCPYVFDHVVATISSELYRKMLHKPHACAYSVYQALLLLKGPGYEARYRINHQHFCMKDHKIFCLLKLGVPSPQAHAIIISILKLILWWHYINLNGLWKLHCRTSLVEGGSLLIPLPWWKTPCSSSGV